MKKYFTIKEKNSERGATMVEFAVIAALVFVLIFGIMETALIFLQEHYVANAAREGLRIGVRANNYDCYKNVSGPGFSSCDSDRSVQVNQSIEEYLATFYDPDQITINLQSVDLDPAADSVRPVLEVDVQTPNFFPAFVSGLLKLLKSDSDVNYPDTIAFSTRLEYEDPKEFIQEP